MEFEATYRAIRREAERLRQRFNKTGDKAAKLRFHVLTELAEVVKRSVPSEPTERDVKRLLLEPRRIVNLDRYFVRNHKTGWQWQKVRKPILRKQLKRKGRR